MNEREAFDKWFNDDETSVLVAEDDAWTIWQAALSTQAEEIARLTKERDEAGANAAARMAEYRGRVEALCIERDALKAEVARLREVLERLAKLTPRAANSEYAEDHHMTVKDIAESTLQNGGDVPRDGETYRIAHDGFEGTVIGSYRTREGKEGVVLQQTGTKVVHVYGRKWLQSGGDGKL